MDFEAHRQKIVAHFVWLYRHAYAGPDQARASMLDYTNRPGCLFPKIGRDVRLVIDSLDLEENNGSNATEAAKRVPGANERGGAARVC